MYKWKRHRNRGSGVGCDNFAVKPREKRSDRRGKDHFEQRLAEVSGRENSSPLIIGLNISATECLMQA